MAFSHKQKTVALPDDLHRRLLVEASRRCQDGQDVREVMTAIVTDFLGPALDKIDRSRAELEALEPPAPAGRHR